MRVVINSQQPIACDDLSALLGLPVLQITRNAVNLETGQLETIVKIDATSSDITVDHEAVLAEVFGGQTVALEADA